MSFICLYLEDSPTYSYILLYLEDSPTYSYIFLYLEDSHIFLYFRVSKKMLNSYLKQMLLISKVYTIRTVKDAVEFFNQVNNQPQKVPLTRELLRNAIMAYASYRQSLDRDKEEKERQLGANSLL